MKLLTEVDINKIIYELIELIKLIDEFDGELK